MTKRKRRSRGAIDQRSDSTNKSIPVGRRVGDSECRWNRAGYPPGPRDDAHMYEVMMITPTARTHGVEPDPSTMRPTKATTSPRPPTRSAQTAILQCPMCCSCVGSSIP
jgi:hypothetical protein